MKQFLIDLFLKIKPRIKISQHVLVNEFQPWLETILLVDDQEAERLSDWTIGFYHCSHCETYQAYAFRLPPKGSGSPVSKEAHNQRNAFWREHAHGDGRILLFEKDIE